MKAKMTSFFEGIETRSIAIIGDVLVLIKVKNQKKR